MGTFSIRHFEEDKEELIQTRAGCVSFFLSIFHSRHAASTELRAGGSAPYLSMDLGRGGNAGGHSFFSFHSKLASFHGIEGAKG